MKWLHILLLTFLLPTTSYTQSKENILLGELTKYRTCFDVNHYDLNIAVDFNNRSISGYNIISFTGKQEENILQIDLVANMVIDSIEFESKLLPFSREHRAVFVTLPHTIQIDSTYRLKVNFHGIPHQAENAPWDGGFVWTKDNNGLPWLGVACQGDGASYWWPNKDHLSDEPDSVMITCNYPSNLFFVGNGNLVKDTIHQDTRTTTWKTEHNINNYNVTLNIADYVHFSDSYIRGTDSLDLDYYILSYNKEKAKKQFQQVKPMLESFEKHFGPYPFPKDGYALVETSYLGMEHQSAIAYGNKYQKGYLGRYPKNIDFDFIIIHETGHEWWGNSISMNDRADMWIHESFCTYSEALYVEDLYGHESMLDYLVYQKSFINHKSPVQGILHTNTSGNHTDMYYKGSWALHSLRNIIQNDSLWHACILELAKKYQRKNVDGKEVISFMANKLNKNLDSFFKLYFEGVNIPKLVTKTNSNGRMVKIKGLPKDLHFPVNIGGKTIELNNRWKPSPLPLSELQKYLERHFLLDTEKQ